MIANVVSAILIVLGTLLTLIAAVGLVRLPDFFARGHAATKGATLGLALTLFSAALQMSDRGDIAKLALAVIAQFLTAPVDVFESDTRGPGRSGGDQVHENA